MALAEKRMEAKQQYIRTSMICADIAKELQVAPKTIYRWKKEDQEKGETYDWDYQRQLYHTSNDEVAAKYQKAMAIMMDRIDKDPTLLIDPKTADALAKVKKAMQGIDDRSQYLNAIIQFVKIAHQWLSEHQPELKTKMAPYWDPIIEELKDYATRKGRYI
jgi:transposase-like protein